MPSTAVSSRQTTSVVCRPSCGGVDRQRHRQAAGQQHDGVDAADQRVQLAAGRLEGLRVAEAVDGVAGEQGAEEQHLGGQEHPHAQRRRPRAAARGRRSGGPGPVRPPRARLADTSFGLLAVSTRKARASPRASRRSCPSAAATASAIPGRSRPTGSARPSCRSSATRAGRSAAAGSRRQDRRAGRRHDVQHLELRRVAVVAPRHAQVAER